MMVRGSGSSSTSSDHQDFDCLPPGYRFCPMDPELLFYLNKKVHRQPLPPNNIIQLNLYAHHPQQLAERYRAQGGRDDNEWFFFTQRERRYATGHRPNRSIEGGHGHWKATGTEKEVIDMDGNIIGYKRSLVFYQGNTHVDGIKTTWLMHEYRLPSPRTSTPNNRFDDYVLCRVYKKHGSSSSTGDRCRGTKRSRSDESAAATLTNEEAVASSNSTSCKIPEFQDRSPNEAEASDRDLQLIAHEINDHTLQNHQQPNIVESTAPRIPSEIHDHVVPRQPPEPAEFADNVFSHNHKSNNNNQMMMQPSTDFAYPYHTAWEISSSTSPNDFDSDIFAYMSFGDRDGYGDGDGSGFCSAIDLSPSYMRGGGGGGGCELMPNYYSNNIHHHHDPIAMSSKPSSIGEDLWGDTSDTFVFNPSDLQWDDSGRD